MTQPTENPFSTDESVALRAEVEALQNDLNRVKQQLGVLEAQANPMGPWKSFQRARFWGIEIGRDFFRAEQGFLQVVSPDASSPRYFLYMLPELTSDPSAESIRGLLGTAWSAATQNMRVFLRSGNTDAFVQEYSSITLIGGDNTVTGTLQALADQGNINASVTAAATGTSVPYVRIHGSGNVPLWLEGGTSDPLAPSDGFIWHRSDTDALHARLASTTETFAFLSDLANMLESGDAITLLDGTAHRLFYTDVNGDIQELGFGTSGQVLTSAGASSAPAFQDAAGGGGMSLVVKSTNESVNNTTTLQNDDEIFFPVGANERWQFEGVIFHLHDNVTPDLKWTFVGPTGSTGAVTIDDSDGSVWGSEPLGDTEVSEGNDFVRQVRFAGAISNGATAGNLQLQWAQDTADPTDSFVLAGSYIKFVQDET